MTDVFDPAVTTTQKCAKFVEPRQTQRDKPLSESITPRLKEVQSRQWKRDAALQNVERCPSPTTTTILLYEFVVESDCLNCLYMKHLPAIVTTNM